MGLVIYALLGLATVLIFVLDLLLTKIFIGQGGS